MFKIYEVGGKVRDELLGVQSKDIDYVAVSDIVDRSDARETFIRLSDWLKSEGYHIFLETPSCYTIRAKFPEDHINKGMTADFVLARKEVGYKEGTREPIVVPGTLLHDLARRDFTINAIAKDIDGKIYDPFNGKLDLELRILRTPISEEVTFQDDPLRILRAIRFAVTKRFNIDESICAIIEQFDYENKFSMVSEERIREELYKCFKHNTLRTLAMLNRFTPLRDYIFKRTKLWLKPTNEN